MKTPGKKPDFAKFFLFPSRYGIAQCLAAGTVKKFTENVPQILLIVDGKERAGPASRGRHWALGNSGSIAGFARRPLRLADFGLRI